MVTHDPKTAAYADQVLHLEKGKLIERAVREGAAA
jgi:ABC-type lipoprotein export system ATPase subunit